MRRSVLSLVLLMVIVSLAPRSRADDAAADQAFFDKQTSKFVKLQPKRLTAEALGKVFKAIIYAVTVQGSDGSSSNAVVARTGDEITLISLPSTTTDMPEMVKMIEPGFVLKADADAKVFQEALDLAYPIDTTFNKDDLATKAIRHKDNQWTFVRGKFFERFKGFIVTTGAGGKVTGVKWSLDDIK